MAVVPVGSVLAGLLAIVKSPYDLILISGVAVLLAALLLPLNALLFLWAALLPVWSIGPLPPEVFDVVRYGIGALIAARSWATGTRKNTELRSWVLPLVAVALIVTTLTWWHGQSPRAGIVMLASVTLVSAMMLRLSDVWPLLLGYATGATVSAVVLIGTAAGAGVVQALVPNDNPGVGRFTGIGSSAPLVSAEFALAVVVWWCALVGRKVSRVVGLLGVVLSVVALLISGGRTGLLALTVVVAVLTVRRWLSPRMTVIAALAVVLGGYWVSQRDIAFHTLERLANFDASDTDITTGRINLLADGWALFVQSPLSGTGSAAHFAPLTFALSGGVVAGATILFLSIRLALMTLAGPRRHASALVQVGALIAAVLTVLVILETNGPFVGLEMVTLLFASVLATRERGKPQRINSRDVLIAAEALPNCRQSPRLAPARHVRKLRFSEDGTM